MKTETVKRLKTDALPIDNITKFAYEESDYEDVEQEVEDQEQMEEPYNPILALLDAIDA